MGLFLDKPKREKIVESGEGNDLRFAVSAMQGWRVDMEDSHSMKINLAPTLKGCSYFAVFDGHAGDFVSKYAAEHLFEVILSNLEGKSSYQVEEARGRDKDTSSNKAEGVDERKNDSENASNLSTNSSGNKVDEAMSDKDMSGNLESIPENKKQVAEIDDPMTTETEQKLSNSNNIINLASDLEYFKDCTRKGFLEIDEKLTQLPRFKAGDERSGTTAIAVFVTATHVIFANCGDSRALLSRSGGKIAFATVDHKPYNDAERKRIEKAGGSVIIQRVNGSLAVSRALGDFDYKHVPGLPCTEQLVSAEPELTCIERHPEDEFLVLACDGIWDVMSNQEVTDFVRYRLSIHQDLEKLCGEILETSLAKGSKDNMSIIIVTFPAAPKISEEEIESEKKLDALLKEKITEYVKKSSEPKSIDTSVIVDFLQDQEISGLPPGGGLSAKMDLIENFLDELVPDRAKDEGPQLGASIPVPLNMMRQFAAGGVLDEEEARSNLREMVKLPNLMESKHSKEDMKTDLKPPEYMPVSVTDGDAAKKFNSIIVNEHRESKGINGYFPCPINDQMKLNSHGKIRQRPRNFLKGLKGTLPTVPEEIFQDKTKRNSKKNECLTFNQLHLRSLQNKNSMAFWRRDQSKHTADLTNCVQKTSSSYLPALNFTNKKKDPA